MPKLLRFCLAPVLAAALLMPVQAMAQKQHAQDSTGHMMPMMGGMMPMMGSGNMMPMMGGMMMPMMMNHTEGYFAFLKAELGITEAQNTLWTAYVEQSRPLIEHYRNAMPMMAPQPAKAAAPSWTERIDKGEAKLAEHLEAVRKIKPAATALYAALSPEQKKKADTFLPGPFGMSMGMPGMHGMHEMGGMQ